MKRKVIQLADSTFVISLPLSWVKHFNIAKGNLVDVAEENETLIVSPESSLKKKFIRIDISPLSERVVRWYLSAIHKSGYDEIDITYKDEAQLKLVHDLKKNLFTGFNIAEETRRSITLKSISLDDITELDAALRRAFRVTISMGDELLSVLEKSNAKLVPVDDMILIKEKELQNNQLTNFCERLINKHKLSDKMTFLYSIIWNIEKICDNYKYIIRDIECHDPLHLSKEVIALFSLANEYLKMYYDIFYDFKIIKLNDINKKYVEINKLILSITTQNKQEIKIINHLNVLITQATDFSASFIAVRGIKDEHK